LRHFNDGKSKGESHSLSPRLLGRDTVGQSVKFASGHSLYPAHPPTNKKGHPHIIPLIAKAARNGKKEWYDATPV
jgi:hypothetical protein